MDWKKGEMVLLLLLLSTSTASQETRETLSLSNHSTPLDENVHFETALDDIPHLIKKEKDEVYVWSEWIVDTPCTDTCGGCGKIHYTRECLCAGDEECPCSVRESRVEVCATNVCQFPRRTCCEGYRKISTPTALKCAPVNGTHEKKEETTTPLKKDEHIKDNREAAKDEDTVWSEWAIVTPCSDTCGACGRTTLTRKCLCAGEEGCPCSKRETRVEVCGSDLCKFPRRTCCEGFTKMSTHSKLQCSPIDEAAQKKKRDEESEIASRKFIDAHKTEGGSGIEGGAKQRGVKTHSHNTPVHEKTVWGEWKATTPCTDTCGGCGKVQLIKECLCAGEEGCPCSESKRREDVCGMGVCKFPRRTCCDGFRKVSTSFGLKCEAENGGGLASDNVIVSPSSQAHSHIHNDFYFASRKFLEREDNVNEETKKDDVSVWGEWIVETPCTDNCGACGRIHLTRACLCAGEEGCPCRNNESRYEVCATKLCHFPRSTCCKGFTKFLTHDGFKCVAENGSNEPICAGQWTPWTADASDSVCPSTCGMCGKRRIATRQCEPSSCECPGESELFESCGRIPCREGVDCCEGFVRGRVDGREECVPSSSVPPSLSVASRKFIEKKKEEEKISLEKRKNQLKQILPVLSSPSKCSWGEWIEIDSECSSSCGMCGVRVASRRTCLPEGCTNCVGPSTRYEDCGEGICEDRDKPCCGFYTQSTVNGVSSCIDPVKIVEETTHIRRAPSSKKDEHKTTLSSSTCRGIWSPFTATPLSSCDNSCGLCGHRLVAERTCTQGCECEGSSKLYERCGEKPCWNKKDGCCEGASIVLVDGKRICKEIN